MRVMSITIIISEYENNCTDQTNVILYIINIIISYLFIVISRMYLYKTMFRRDIRVGGVSDNNRLIIDDNLLCANDIFENILYGSKGLYVYIIMFTETMVCAHPKWDIF